MNKIKQVLVVDDSKLARLTLARLLKNLEIEVLEADSVDSGLEVLRAESIDAIFLDVQMPEKTGFDGLKLIKEDRKLRKIPCSMYSGDLSVEAQQEAISKGAQAYLFKPANAESLEHVLHALAANIVADDMQQYATPAQQAGTPSQPAAHQTIKHKKALMTLDGRTRSLARLFNQGRQETKVAVTLLTDRLSNVNEEVESLKKQNKHAQHDDLLHKRAENDIRGQLQRTRDNLRLAITVAIISVVLAGVALAITGFIYFNYLQK